MTSWVDSLRSDTGLRAGLLRTGRFTPLEVGELLGSLELEGGTRWGELSAAEQARVLEALEAATGEAVAAPGGGWGPWLDRVRAMLYRYALVYQPLLWDRGRPEEALVAGMRRFLGLASASTGMEGEVAELEERLEERPEPGEDAAGVRWLELSDLFRLSGPEEDALWLLLAPMLAPEFQWLSDALLRRGLDGMLPVSFLHQVLQGAHPSLPAAEIAAIFAESGTLRHYGLVRPGGPSGMLRVEERVVDWLQSPAASAVPRWMASLLRLDASPGLFDPSQALRWMDASLPRLLREWLRAGRTRVLVSGPASVGARTLARVMGQAQGMQVGVVELGALLAAGDEAWPAVLREARLQRAVLLLTEVRALGAEGVSSSAVGRLLALLQRERAPMVFEGGADLDTGVLLELVETLDLAVVALAIPEVEVRETMWTAALGSVEGLGVGEDARLARVARSYPFGIDQVEEGLRLGRVYTQRDAEVSGPLGESALHRACQALVTHRLGELAQRVEVRHGWDDLVLSEELEEQVRTLLSFGLLSKKVLEEWGYGKRLSYGRGLSALFSGPSGTGKTMIAGLIANELGMDLYRIDLSRIVSKYIGETEQRLDSLFEEARRARCALLFDEADSLFGKRTEVKSSTDRYANLEVNYMLQKLEDHPGVVLLTSNFPKSIDEAFLRRLRFRVHFPRPDESLRAELWQRMIPPEAPQEADLRLKDIATRYELSGGEIRNAVLRAALFAAAESRALSPADLERSARAEYRQLGRLLKD